MANKNITATLYQAWLQ